MRTLLAQCFRGILKCRNISDSSKCCVHTYKSLYPWENTVDFSKHLLQSVVYRDHGLIVLNKPYGVSFARDAGTNNNDSKTQDPESQVFENKKQLKNKKYHTFFTSGIVSDNLNLVDCLPYLKENLGLPKLHIARVPEKYVSGVAILTNSKELVEKINEDRTKSHTTGKDKYLIVVTGVPRSKSGKIKLAFKLEYHPNFGKRVILLEKWSNNDYKNGKVRIGTFHYETICTGYKDLSSLLEVRVDLRKYHAYRAFASDYLLSPVLGDNLFSGRVQTVMGVPMKVSPFTEAANSHQVLPDEMYSLLDLTPQEASCIPVHIHLQEMLLPDFLAKKKDIILRAPIPHYFQWTCEKLGLQLEDNISVAAG